MNQRLKAIFSLIRPGRGVIDVGTDHGYLPERLALSEYPGRIFASDIREGPLNAAKRTAARSGLTDRICFQLADGLDACPPKAVDTIVIAGMGGDTVCGILDRAEWCMNSEYHLILQPMSKAEILRYWLVNNGFRIEKELLVEEGREIYQIVGARYEGRNERLSDAELFIGRAGVADAALYQKLVCRQINRLEQLIAGLQRSSDGCRREQLDFYGSVLNKTRLLKVDHDD